MLWEGTKFTEEKELPVDLQLLVALGTPKSPKCLGNPGFLWRESLLSGLPLSKPFYKPALLLLLVPFRLILVAGNCRSNELCWFVS